VGLNGHSLQDDIGKVKMILVATQPPTTGSNDLPALSLVAFKIDEAPFSLLF
jgi:hypothetical protein